MKVLWLINGPSRRAINKLKLSKQNPVGWIDLLCDMIADKNDIDICIVFPQHKSHKILEYHSQKESYYAYYEDAKPREKISQTNVSLFKNIISEEKPDIIHIWGTEYSHALEMMYAFNEPNRTIVSIQGLISVCEKYYYSGLPRNIVYRYTFRDLLKRDNIYIQKKKYFLRGKMEKEVLNLAKNVVGRTDWDKAHVLNINPKIEYFHGGELLRDDFYRYGDSWKYSETEPNTIFTSQGWYPIKGLHILIEAVHIVKKKYPNVKLYVGGGKPYKSGISGKLRQGSYGKYIRTLIKRYRLQDNIYFTGELEASQMAEILKNSNVFVMPSTIENSPNSLSEAMMIGIPCVCSAVGGIKSVISNEMYKNMYQYDDPVVLASYIEKVFNTCEKGEINTEHEVKKAYDNHNPKKVYGEYIKIYNTVYSQAVKAFDNGC